MNKFNVGDRVRLVKMDEFDGYMMRMNDTGTVLLFEEALGERVMLVQWDNPVDTSCDGAWYCLESDCEPEGGV